MRTAKEIILEVAIDAMIAQDPSLSIDDAEDDFLERWGEDKETEAAMVKMVNIARMETIYACAERMDMIYWDGFHKVGKPTKYFQSGSDNIQPNKQSILNLINELK